MYVLDSNIIIGFLNGNVATKNWIRRREEEKEILVISIITQIEILGVPWLQDENLEDARRFVGAFRSIPVLDSIANLAAHIRRKGVLDIADAIIVATASERQATLVTNDKILIKRAGAFVKTLSI